MNLLEEFESNSSTFMVLSEMQNSEIYSKVLKFDNNHKNSTVYIDDSFFITFWKIKNNKITISVDFEWEATLDFDHKTDWTKLHNHAYIEMTYVVKGELTQLIGGQKHTFSVGEVCIIDRNSEHTDYLKDQDNLLISFCLKREYFNELFIAEIEEDEFQTFIRKALLEQKSLKQFLKFSPRSKETVLLPLIEQITQENKEKDKGYPYIIRGLMIRLFDTLIRQYHLSLNASQLKKTNQLLFIQVEEYIREHYKDVTIKELVKRFHFQEDYFTRLFKKHIGMTFSQYIRDIRLTKAAELIQNTNMTISSIIESVGYNNRYHFYILFKERYGNTPEQFRQTQALADK